MSSEASSPTAGKPRDFILREATRLFGENGYTGTTMRDIATAVGVLPGSLYAHIEAKETLLLEIVESGIDEFLAAVADLGEAANPAQRMRKAVKAHVRVVSESPSRTLVVFHQWRFLTGASRATIIDKRRQYEEFFATAIADGIRSGVFSPQLDARIAVLGILGALNWTAEWYSPEGPADADEVGDRLADVLLEGLLKT
jgi:TetR/AcrR family transcriptional regulator, cholesterol catabolism regulator